MDRQSVNEMLNTSLEDYREYEESKKEGQIKLSRLRDSAQKLLAVLREYTAIKMERTFKNNKDFKNQFTNLPGTGLSSEGKKDLIDDINTLHISGLLLIHNNKIEEEIERTYHKTYRIIKMLVTKGLS